MGKRKSQVKSDELVASDSGSEEKPKKRTKKEPKAKKEPLARRGPKQRVGAHREGSPPAPGPPSTSLVTSRPTPTVRRISESTAIS
jgi:hypothetical protein